MSPFFCFLSKKGIKFVIKKNRERLRSKPPYWSEGKIKCPLASLSPSLIDWMQEFSAFIIMVFVLIFFNIIQVWIPGDMDWCLFWNNANKSIKSSFHSATFLCSKVISKQKRKKRAGFTWTLFAFTIRMKVLY